MFFINDKMMFNLLLDRSIDSLTKSFKDVLSLVVGVAFAIIAIGGASYIGWLGFKMGKAEDEAQRNEMKKNMAWKIKIFLLVIVLMASFTTIWTFVQEYIHK